MNYALINNGVVVRCIVADPDFVNAIAADWDHIEPVDAGVSAGWGWTGAAFVAPASPQEMPQAEIILTGITSNVQEGFDLSPDLSDVTVPVGATLAFTAELRMHGQVLPLDDTFRMPIRSRDGRERVLAASMSQGVITFGVRFDDSRVWEVTEAVINADLPSERHMRFKGIKVFAVET